MNANKLLGDLDALRRRTRADRRGYAFPLFLFGFLFISILLAIASRDMVRNGLYSTPGADLSLMAGSTAVTAGMLVWGSRPGRSERARTVASVVGGLFAGVSLLVLLAGGAIAVLARRTP